MCPSYLDTLFFGRFFRFKFFISKINCEILFFGLILFLTFFFEKTPRKYGKNTQIGSSGLSLKNKIDIIDYKKQFNNIYNTRIAEIFSYKLNVKIDRRSAKRYCGNEAKIRYDFVANTQVRSIPRNIKYDIIDQKLKEWADMIWNKVGSFHQ
ncbi:hypothetical protein DMUE_4980 [Dictyocoela muelleri]|nr:hypothetical protein DMUE_4980 [Dictyocoela muelleri]